MRGLSRARNVSQPCAMAKAQPDPSSATTPSWYFRIRPRLAFRELKYVRENPDDLVAIARVFFWFGGHDDGPIYERIQRDPEARRVLDERQNELLTEHAVLDDNGDCEGSYEAGLEGPDGLFAATFTLGGVQGEAAAATDDPVLAGLYRERDEVTYGHVPPGAVVVPGSLPSDDGRYSLACAVIVKRVDARTRAKVGINELLRSV